MKQKILISLIVLILFLASGCGLIPQEKINEYLKPAVNNEELAIGKDESQVKEHSGSSGQTSSVRSEDNDKESEDQAIYKEEGKEKEKKKEKVLEKEERKKEAKKVKQTKQKIKVNKAYLYEYPDREADKLGKLAKGDMVEVLEVKAEEDDAEIWCYVKIKKNEKKEDVQYGWILFSAIDQAVPGKSHFSPVREK